MSSETLMAGTARWTLVVISWRFSFCAAWEGFVQYRQLLSVVFELLEISRLSLYVVVVRGERWWLVLGITGALSLRSSSNIVVVA